MKDKTLWMQDFLRYLKEYAATHPHFRGDEPIAAFRREKPRDEPPEVNWYGQAVLQGKKNGWYSKLIISTPQKSRGHRMEVTMWRSHLYPHKSDSDKYNLNKQKSDLRKKAITEGMLITDVIERAVHLGLHYREPV